MCDGGGVCWEVYCKGLWEIASMCMLCASRESAFAFERLFCAAFPVGTVISEDINGGTARFPSDNRTHNKHTVKLPAFFICFPQLQSPRQGDKHEISKACRRFPLGCHKAHPQHIKPSHHIDQLCMLQT